MFRVTDRADARRSAATTGRAGVTCLLLLALILSLAGTGWIKRRADSASSFDRSKMALLEQENKRLRGIVEGIEIERRHGEEDAFRTEIEQQVSRIRGLKFKQPVTYDVLARSDIEAVINQKIDEQYSSGELADLQKAYIAMGLLPEGFDLRKAYIELMGEQIAAFYDQFTDTLYSFENTPLRKAQNRIILAHELTHALQDQNFHLDDFPLLRKDNDDLVMATSALIEGDATLLMTEYMLDSAGSMPPQELIIAAFGQNMGELRNVPRYLRESLLFPYIAGQKFAAALFARGGFRALDAAFQLCPTSTSQILHPEKYLADPGATPTVLEWTGWRETGARVVADNVLGEFGWRTLLSNSIPPDEAEEVCNGWIADRYLVLEKDSECLVAASTLWESKEKADSFEIALRQMLEARHASDGRLFLITRPEPTSVDYWVGVDDVSLELLKSVRSQVP